MVAVLVAGGAVWRAYDQGVFSAGRGPAKPWLKPEFVGRESQRAGAPTPE